MDADGATKVSDVEKLEKSMSNVSTGSVSEWLQILDCDLHGEKIEGAYSFYSCLFTTTCKNPKIA